jgi:Prokaryotic N-terminal methylation motif
MKKSGQTLLEVMIALFVLTAGFLGILSLLSQSIFISKNISDQATATYLASEGIEVAKNLIDHDVYEHLAGCGAWGTCFGAGGYFEFDYTTTDCSGVGMKKYANLGSADPNPPDFLYYNPVTHEYLYSFGSGGVGGGSPTIFKRGIEVIPNGASEITVQSTVTWSNGLPVEQSVILEDHFYNWYPT